MTPQEQQRRTMELIAPLNSEEIRTLGIAALRRWYEEARDHTFFEVHGHLGFFMVGLLVQRTGETQVHHSFGKEAFHEDLYDPSMALVFEFLWWLIRAGLASPLRTGRNPKGEEVLVHLRPTEAGIRLLQNTDDHPVLPGYLARVSQRCPGIPSEAVAHLADATTCLDHALGRPAVVLAGLAYETTIDEIVTSLIAKSKLPANTADLKPAMKGRAVRALVPDAFPGKLPAEVSARFAAVAAWDFADRLRDRRNEGAHPGGQYDFTDLTECHEYLLSAGRHLPALWSIGVR